MAYDLNGSNQAISYTLNASQTSLSQITIARWLYPDAVGQYKRDFHFGPGYPNQQGLMQMDDGWGWVFGWRYTTGSGAWSIPKPSTGAWIHNTVTLDASSASNDPIIYNNGVSQTITERGAPSGTSNVTSTALYLGSEANGGQYWDGRIAEFAIWNRVLSQAEVTILANGFSPLFIPNGLVFYAPLIRETTERRFGLTGTLANSPSVIAHPRITIPSNGQLFPFTTTASGSPEPTNAVWFGINF